MTGDTVAAPLGSGRTADVHAIDHDRVVRRYRLDIDATAEAAVMRHVHAHGFPTPAVHRADRSEIEMERLHGPTMLSALVAGTATADDSARILARLHADLHLVPPVRGAAGPSDSVIHLDLHPDNVVLTRRGPVLIDWTNATDGSGALDVAVSAVILAQVAVGATSPLATAACELLSRFVVHAGRPDPAALDRAVAFRGADPTQSQAELELLARARTHVQGLDVDQ